MKHAFHVKKTVWLALMLGPGISTAAIAQSNVTIYGYLDVGIVKESRTSTRESRGLNNWLGFKGSEALGGDLSAVFKLEMRFLPDTGAQERSTTLFQGESTAGLSSKSLGTLLIGRAWTPLWAGKWAYDPWYDSAMMGSLGAYNGDFDSDGLNLNKVFANYSRVSNALFYRSPNFADFQFSLVGEVESVPGARKRSRGGALQYGHGPVSAMLAYEKNHVADDVVYAGASYTMGPVVLMGSYSRTHLFFLNTSSHSAMVAATYAIGNGMLRGGYGRIKESHANKTSAGYVHKLSKRTSVYADVYRERISRKQDGVALGITHSF
ncbi:porin [Massilia sp. DJPM01]|uniref:porin n=1 Tax=Massilia sp. DJPM01 TaxID=3024404 RepID=UPI00259D4576|nr:porin [Massilia sp. DJPM01]MDM5180638.1 porin [Massilia sp. DJPM01]